MSPPEPTTRPREAPAPELCQVRGCGAEAIRHLSLAEARKVFPDLPDKGRRTPLCRDHYKQWKKETKQARKLDRLGW